MERWACTAELLKQCLDRIRRPRAERNRAALLEQASDDRAPDPACAAGDERDLSFKLEVHQPSVVALVDRR
jgi:hypothetical protein